MYVSFKSFPIITTMIFNPLRTKDFGFWCDHYDWSYYGKYNVSENFFYVIRLREEHCISWFKKWITKKNSCELVKTTKKYESQNGLLLSLKDWGLQFAIIGGVYYTLKPLLSSVSNMRCGDSLWITYIHNYG